jgi:pimeloyl-ACP methyl ester carboxylesterase
MAESVQLLYSDIRKNRDIIFVDQRGTGNSNPFLCDMDQLPIDQLSEAQQQSALTKAVDRCIEKYATHLPFYTTPFAVADLDAIRIALGYETINLWGGSYGSRVVLNYLHQYSQHARSAIIDGVAPTDIALPWFMEADALSALTKIDTQCHADTTCFERYGNLLEKAQRVSDRLAQQSVVVTISHPRTQEKLPVTLNAAAFATLLHMALYNRELSTLLPKIISDAEQQDYQLLSSLYYLVSTKTELHGINYALHYLVACSEDYPLYKDKEARDSNHFFSAKMVQRYSQICEKFSLGLLPKDYWNKIQSSVPLLMLSGAADPATPPHWAEFIQKDFANTTHLIAPGGHHIVSQEGCMPQLISNFISAGNSQALNTECIEHIQPTALYIAPQSPIATAPSAVDNGVKNDSHQ